MRLALAAILAAFALAAAAQSAPRPRPPGTVPLEEPPAPPPMADEPQQPELKPEITTRTEGENEIQEYRVKGKLYMMRVTPRHGRSYILMDQQGTGTFVRQDNPLDTGVRVPQWVLMEF